MLFLSLIVANKSPLLLLPVNRLQTRVCGSTAQGAKIPRIVPFASPKLNLNCCPLEAAEVGWFAVSSREFRECCVLDSISLGPNRRLEFEEIGEQSGRLPSCVEYFDRPFSFAYRS